MDSGKNVTRNPATKQRIPTMFRCKVGKEWKPLSSFSNNQQRLLQLQIAQGTPIAAASSGMTCRDHTSGARTEIQCGVCGLMKPADDYSRSSRRNGVFHCKRCVAWIETQEPDVTPTPLETGHISIEEERQEIWKSVFVESTDFFSDDIMPQAPVTAMASLGLEDLDTPSGVDVKALISESSVDGKSSISSAPSNTKSLPPHLIKSLGPSVHSENQVESATTMSSKSSTCGRSVSGIALPPHLKGKWVPSATASDAASDMSDNYDCVSGSVSTATTVREGANHKRRVSFNAWDPSGTQRRGVKSATTDTGTESSEAASEAGEDQDGLADLPLGKQPASRGRNKWYNECRLTQTELRRMGANHHVVARSIEPPIDRQRQQNAPSFCEPDDDDDLYDI